MLVTVGVHPHRLPQDDTAQPVEPALSPVWGTAPRPKLVMVGARRAQILTMALAAPQGHLGEDRVDIHAQALNPLGSPMPTVQVVPTTPLRPDMEEEEGTGEAGEAVEWEELDTELLGVGVVLDRLLPRAQVGPTGMSPHHPGELDRTTTPRVRATTEVREAPRPQEITGAKGVAPMAQGASHLEVPRLVGTLEATQEGARTTTKNQPQLVARAMEVQLQEEDTNWMDGYKHLFTLKILQLLKKTAVNGCQ